MATIDKHENAPKRLDEDDRVFPGKEGERSAGEPAQEPQYTAGKKQRAAAGILAGVSILLIAFSLSTLAWGDPTGWNIPLLGNLLQTTAPADTGSVKSASKDADKADAKDSAEKGEAEDEQGSDEDSASAEDGSSTTDEKTGDNKAGTSKSDSSKKSSSTASSSTTSGTSSTGGSSASTSTSAGASSNNTSQTTPSQPSTPAEQPKPQTVTVSITVDASAVGGGTLASTTLTFNQGATVYDALCGCGISVNASNSPLGIYVRGIGGYAEFDYGDNSGWLYYVNGVSANKSCAKWVLKDGDSIRWTYTPDYTK